MSRQDTDRALHPRGFRARGAALAVVLGCFFGVAGFTFQYGEGLSYLTKDPRACMNCHIMAPQFDSWQKASHHTVASCIDCHLPHDLVGKYLAKADNGYRHSKAFTLQDYAEPIRITPGNSRILQENCVGCHAELVDSIVHGASDEAVNCVHCHQTVGHGERVGLGGPETPREREESPDE